VGHTVNRADTADSLEYDTADDVSLLVKTRNSPQQRATNVAKQAWKVSLRHYFKMLLDCLL